MATYIKRGEHGTQNLWLYPIQNQAYGTGIKQPGLRAFSIDQEEDPTTFYADDKPWLVINGAKQITGTLTTYQFEEETYNQVLGYHTNANGMRTDTGASTPVGAVYATKTYNENGEESFKLRGVTTATFSPFSPGSVTDEDAVELVELSADYSAVVSSFVKDDQGKAVALWEIEMPAGTTEDDVDTLLAAGMPLPTDTIFTQSTFAFTSTTPTDTTCDIKYDYDGASGNVSSSTVELYETVDLTTSVDSFTPATVGTDSTHTFNSLQPTTTYTLKAKEGNIEIATSNFTTTDPAQLQSGKKRK